MLPSSRSLAHRPSFLVVNLGRPLSHVPSFHACRYGLPSGLPTFVSVHPIGRPTSASTQSGFNKPVADSSSCTVASRYPRCNPWLWLLLPSGPVPFHSDDLGVGQDRCSAAVRRSSPPSPCFPTPFASLDLGVGHRLAAPGRPFLGSCELISSLFSASFARGVGQ